MATKNLSLAFRHIMRYRTYSFLNIIGLAIGMASAMLIILWVDNEVNMDKFHKNGKDIYLLRKQMHFSDGQISIDPSITSPLAPAVSNEVPEVKTTVRVTWNNPMLIRLGERSFFEKGFYADSCFFKVFSFKLLIGDSLTVLNNPNSVAISEKLAKKFFGTENPIGKSLIIRHRDNIREDIFTITGVFKNVSKLSSIEFDFVLPFSKYYQYNKEWLHWGNYNLMTFVLAKPKTDVKVLNKKIDAVLKKYDSWAKKNVNIFGQPLEETYLYDDFKTSITKPSGRILYVRIFSLVAIFIIILACMNYMNLATALAMKRAKEVGVKKVYGSAKFKLVRQFTIEAFILTFIAFIFSVVILECVLPFFNQLIDKEISLDFTNFKVLGYFLTVPIITGFLSGTFPAFYISSFKPVTVLKGMYRPKNGTFQLRHILVIFQFVITIAFIISSIVIVKQIKYIHNKTLGLDKDNIIFFEQSMQIQKHRERFKQEIKRQPGVINVCYTGSNPLEVNSSTTDPSWRGKPAGQDFLFPEMAVDQDFVNTLGAEIIEGRNFSTDFPSDTNCLIFNQEAMKIMHLESPIGEVVSYWGRKANIVGIVKDFHIGNLHNPIKQLMIMCRPNDTWLCMIKIQGNKRKEALKNIENVFRDFENNVPFQYKFLDEEYEKNYDREKYMSRFSNLFAVLAIIISCLGLFGLALFTAEQKTKEIGIRKSNGATNFQVVTLLVRDLIKLIAISYIIACIISYYYLHNWLINFAYRTELSWWIFAVTGFITLSIALITVSWQSWVASKRNPVESLRYE